jgi:hypothetical protein
LRQRVQRRALRQQGFYMRQLGLNCAAHTSELCNKFCEHVAHHSGRGLTQRVLLALECGFDPLVKQGG